MADVDRAKAALQKALIASSDESKSPQERDAAKQLAKRIAAQIKGPSTTDKAKDLVTGELRMTPDASQGFGLPTELDGEGTFGKRFKVAMGLMTSMDPQRQMAVIAENFPGVVFDKDEKGNFIVDARAIGGTRGALNEPGADMRDLIKFGGLMAGFTPAGRSAVAGGGLLANAGRVGAASALTQGAMDAGNQALGGTNYERGESSGFDLADINQGDVAMAGGAGAAGQALFQSIGNAWRSLTKGQGAGVLMTPQSADHVTPDMRQAVKDVIKGLGGNADDMSDEAVFAAFSGTGISDDVVTALRQGQSLDDALAYAQKAANAGERRFGIELSQGQRSGSPKQLQFEEAARMGAMGDDNVRNLALAQQSRQQAQSINAAQNVQRDIAGGARNVSTTNQASQMAADTVADKSAALYQRVREAYDAVPGDVALNTDGARKLFTGMNRAMRGTDVARDLPQTAATIKDIGSMQKLLKTMSGNRARIPIKQLEGFRKRLNTRIGAADPSDARQLIQVKQAFDDYLDDAVARGLVAGGDDTGKALEQLKQARELRRQYSSLYEPQAAKTRAGVRDNDPAGRLVNKIAELNPTTEEVTQALWGSGKAFGNRGSASLATRMRDIVGPDSQEWQAIREAGFLRLLGLDSGVTEGTKISGREFLTRLQQATSGKGETLGKVLYTPEELNLMRQLGRQMVRSQPAPLNPSGTAGQVGFQLREGLQAAADKLGVTMGFATGNPGAVVLAKVGQSGMQAANDKAVRAAAQQAFSGRPLVNLVTRPQTVGVSQQAAESLPEAAGVIRDAASGE